MPNYLLFLFLGVAAVLLAAYPELPSVTGQRVTRLLAGALGLLVVLVVLIRIL